MPSWPSPRRQDHPPWAHAARAVHAQPAQLSPANGEDRRGNEASLCRVQSLEANPLHRRYHARQAERFQWQFGRVTGPSFHYVDYLQHAPSRRETSGFLRNISTYKCGGHQCNMIHGNLRAQ